MIRASKAFIVLHLGYVHTAGLLQSDFCLAVQVTHWHAGQPAI